MLTTTPVTLSLFSGKCGQVWTGLRFLAGQWFWMGDGAAVQVTKEIQCDQTQSFCGVLVKNSTNLHETEDCSKELNFLCYRKP